MDLSKTDFLKHESGCIKNILIPLSIFACFSWLALQPDIALAIPELSGVSGLIVILLVIGQTDLSSISKIKVKKTPANSRSNIFVSVFNYLARPWSVGFILFFSLLLRLLFLWHPPTLSDDIYRYCLDGLTLISGENPYSYAPLDMSASCAGNLNNSCSTVAALIPLVNHPHLPTIYPPAAQIVFATGAFVGKIIMGTSDDIISLVTGMKVVLIIMDLSCCALIIGILKKMNLPIYRSTIYAWNPLPVIEIGASGHIDTAAIFFLLMAIYVALHPEIKKGYWWSVLMLSGVISGVFMGLSVLTKWMPMMFFPGLLFLLRCTRKKIAATAGFTAVIGISIVLFWPDILNAFGTLSRYLQNWEFSGFVFRLVRGSMQGHIAQSGAAARIIIAVIFLYLAYTIFLRLFKNHALQSIMRSFFMVTLAWLILTPTLYPWYSLYLVAFLPFTLNTVGITLGWSVLLSYQILIPYKLTGQWIESSMTPLLIVAAPASACAGQLLCKYFYRAHKIRKNAS